MSSSLPAPSGVFAYAANQAAQYQSLSLPALNRGATQLAASNYDAAITEFKRAIAYDPSSADAFLYLGKAYAGLGQNDQAIASYQKAVQVAPAYADARTTLGYALLGERRNAEAEVQFKAVAKQNPADAGATAGLGYFYLSTGRTNEAETQFNRAINLAPNDPAAHYSLGLVYNAQKRYDEAISQFDTALQLRPNYVLARTDLARAYFANGDADAAYNQVNELSALGTNEADSAASTLRNEFFTPKIVFADTTKSTFKPLLGPGTDLTTLDPAFATPGVTRTFTMSFQFNQNMDLNSVEDIYNWSISKSTGGSGGVYNFGNNLHPEKEAKAMPFPVAVRYDPQTMRAVVTFAITQNATGNAVFDPSHLAFRFHGVAADGTPMDPAGDQYDGAANRGY